MVSRPPTLAEVIGAERFRALVLVEREQEERIIRRRAQMWRARRRRVRRNGVNHETTRA